MIKEKVLKTIREHALLKNKKHIILGLSGGPDSVCLFYILLGLGEELGFSLYPVHVNHKFRPGAAERDQEYVERLCAEKGRPCRTYVIDCNRIAEERNIAAEEAGRAARYEAFAGAAEELRRNGIPRGQICIAVAQNADDQAETILFRILRGASTDGLTGMRYKREDERGNVIIRPLLDVTRKEVEEYCAKNHLEPCMDETNRKPIYTRNRIRLDLIPRLEEQYNANIKDTLVRMGKNAATDSDFLMEETEKAFASALKERDEDHMTFDGGKLRKLHKAIRQRVIKTAFKALGLVEDMTLAHFEGCESTVFHEKPSAKFDLPYGFYIEKSYGDIRTAWKGPARQGEEPEDGADMEILTVEEYSKKEKIPFCFAAFDYGKMEKAFGKDFEKKVVLRGRKPGDYFAFTVNHTKKIQDYFVDAKIPREERRKTYLLAHGSEILWIVPKNGGGRYSSRYKLCGETKKVFYVEIVRHV